jgi:hypothetical protein
MKFTRWFLPIAVLATGIAISGCPVEPPDQPYYVGMSRQQVFEALGDADTIFYGTTRYTPGLDNDVDAYFVYIDVQLSFRIIGSSVEEISILGAGTDWVFDNGLRVGLTRAEALAILGTGYVCFPSTGRDSYQYSSLGITLEVNTSSDRVTEINITSNALPWDLHDGTFVPPDQSWYVGMGRQQVFDTLGDADAIFYGPDTFTPGLDNDVDAYFVYNDVHLSFRIFGSSVREITILSAGTEWLFDNGLCVGLTRAEALAALGTGYACFPNTGKDFYQYTSLGIVLEVSDASDRVTEINITSNSLHWDQP